VLSSCLWSVLGRTQGAGEMKYKIVRYLKTEDVYEIEAETVDEALRKVPLTELDVSEITVRDTNNKIVFERVY
jgi:hypothetical protein